MIATTYLRIDPRNPQKDIIERAAQHIRAGELVAFPTETVYGLGADAFQPSAVEKIFLAKGRPPENPLLVHISNLSQLEKLVCDISPQAQKLMDHFWPGPLSIILPARSDVPEIVRGGRSGVGLRMPSHPVALALIEAAGPLAAPSANLYGRPSPTSAEHVRQDLDNKIAVVLDAGETGAGLESTLIDLSTVNCRIIRRGGIRVEDIEKCLGQHITIDEPNVPTGYRTELKVYLCENETDLEAKAITLETQGIPFGAVHINKDSGHKIENMNRSFILKTSDQGSNLYSLLREAEDDGIKVLLFAPVNSGSIGAALMDRLLRLTAGNNS